MWTIMVTLIIGFIIGYSNLIPKKYLSLTHWITTGGLIVLLVSMGASLSSNPTVLEQINQLGVRAFLLACSSVIGSVLLVWFLERKLFKQKGVED